MTRLWGRRTAGVLATAWLAGCASYAGSGLAPGVDGRERVLAVMGQPALSWRESGGGERLAYPRGPAGYHTFMVTMGADGRLVRIENVLDEAHFAALAPGQSDRAAVLRLFGPPLQVGTFPARNEEVWEYRYCDQWNYPARFAVLIDAASGVARGALGWREDSGRARSYCSR